MTPGQPVAVAERGPNNTDTWQAVYLGICAPGWCEIKRIPGGGIYRVPERLVKAEEKRG